MTLPPIPPHWRPELAQMIEEDLKLGKSYLGHGDCNYESAGHLLQSVKDERLDVGVDPERSILESEVLSAQVQTAIDSILTVNDEEEPPAALLVPASKGSSHPSPTPASSSSAAASVTYQ